jgi:hypothetical protein
MITVFGDFCQFLGGKSGVFLKNKCYDAYFAKISCILILKMPDFSPIFFGENIFKKS